jgi:hypothetical protein
MFTGMEDVARLGIAEDWWVAWCARRDAEVWFFEGMEDVARLAIAEDRRAAWWIRGLVEVINGFMM